jgi:hypothetical protein
MCVWSLIQSQSLARQHSLAAQERISAEYGMPPRYQKFDVDGVSLPASSRMQEMWIGPDSVLKMLTCSPEWLEEVARSGDVNEWLTLLAGGWGEIPAPTYVVEAPYSTSIMLVRKQLKEVQEQRAREEQAALNAPNCPVQ